MGLVKRSNSEPGGLWAPVGFLEAAEEEEEEEAPDWRALLGSDSSAENSSARGLEHSAGCKHDLNMDR
jgi:hypothetical protein